MTDLLVGLLPAALRTVVDAGILVLATGVVAGLLVRRFSTRRALFIHSFGQPAVETSVDGKALADGVRTRLRQVWEAHTSRALVSEGEATNLADPRRQSEHLGAKAVSLLADSSPLGFLVGLTSRIWPTLELEGEVVVGDRRALVAQARLRKGKRFYHAWQTEAPREAAGLDSVIDELAYRIALDTARLGVLDASRSAGTRSWQAFRALTEAMTLWNADDFRLEDDGKVAAVEAKLEEAIRLDPGYALAHYNRGNLLLVTYRDAATNARAREHFKRARELAVRQADTAATEKVFVDRRLEGLANLGISRTLSQDRHRFGHEDPEVLADARRTASQAVSVLGETTPALYALAFAWHCTETLEDIREGRRIYERIVQREPARHRAVHNNLGFILMVGGERLRALGRDAEAAEWWEEAERHMAITLRISGPQSRTREFTHANLGNLYRLQERYAESEAEYLKALGPEPHRSWYINGMNELACLYRDMGRTDEARRLHDAALAAAGDGAHRARLSLVFAGGSAAEA